VVEANLAAIEAEERGTAAPKANGAKKPAKATPKASGSKDATRAKRGGQSKTAAKPAAKPKATKPRAERPSGLNLAAKVLADAGGPLDAKTIAELAIAAGWNTKGATPHATLYAAIIREIAAKGNEARFEKVDRGRFQIRKAVA